MVKVKVSELTGTALDWAVAKCRGFESLDEDLWLVQEGITDMPLSAYNPSTDWSQGGSIIEREGITTVLCSGDLGEPRSYWTATNEVQCWQWGYGPYHEQDDEKSLQVYHNGVHTGPTPLIAAMRCFVASKLGDEVDVPEELVCD